MKATEFEVVLKVSISSTLDKKELERQLVVALWEGMDESVLIPDGADDRLRVIEDHETYVEVSL